MHKFWLLLLAAATLVVTCCCCWLLLLQLYDDFALVRPTIVASTPRLWTMMYNQYLQELQEAFVKQQTDHEHPDFIPEFPDPNKGRDPATDSENTPGATSSDVRGHDLRHFNVEKVPADLRKAVMSRFKSKLGGREKMITTGGAPTGKMVKRFIIDCFEGMVNDGYGSTEVRRLNKQKTSDRHTDRQTCMQADGWTDRRTDALSYPLPHTNV